MIDDYGCTCYSSGADDDCPKHKIAASSSLLPVSRQLTVEQWLEGIEELLWSHEAHCLICNEPINCDCRRPAACGVHKADCPIPKVLDTIKAFAEYCAAAGLPAGESAPVKPCKHCGHTNPHDGPAGTVDDACTEPGCNCGFYQPELGVAKHS